ncbi:hypothetical protein [Pseudonocardia sp. T1-2H]|uniref:hypothetical protein n=1 Tax=Pseudonocardia sp. T1-2H TaxID=3128899 RepID=UPI0031018712
MSILRDHMATFELGEGGLLFPNEAGGAPRRTIFRSRHWRPALVRAGLLGSVVEKGDKFQAAWSTEDGRPHRELFATRAAAIKTVARKQAGGLRFHDLRHSYAT